MRRRFALAPVVHVKDGTVFANSKDVADYFGKRHADVLRDIHVIETNANLRPSQFNELFRATTYQDRGGRARATFDMTRDGFTLLVMGYTGKKGQDQILGHIRSKTPDMGECLGEENPSISVSWG